MDKDFLPNDYVEELKEKVIALIKQTDQKAFFSVNEYYNDSQLTIRLVANNISFPENQLIDSIDGLFKTNPLYLGTNVPFDKDTFDINFKLNESASKNVNYIVYIKNDSTEGYLMWHIDAMYIGKLSADTYKYPTLEAAIQAGQNISKEYGFVKPTIKVFAVKEVYNQ